MFSSLITFAICCAHAASPSGRIAYLSGTEQEDLCVCVLDLATGETVRVGEGARDGAPVWSPDGAWIAFPSHGAEGMGIRLVQPYGSERRSPVHAHAWNQAPRWAPDARRLAYTADDGKGFDSVIVVYDLGANSETVWGGGRTGLSRPVWISGMKLLNTLLHLEQSQRGNARIASNLVDDINRSGALLAIGLIGEPGKYSSDIFLVTESGSVPLVPPEMNPGTYFDWSAETNAKGSMIAFESNDGGDREIFVFSSSGRKDVSNHREADWNPVWSPKGNWLAFESFRTGRRSILRVFPETIRVQPVAQTEDADNWSPAWSPDGGRLAFVSDRSGNPDIWLSTDTGENPRQLTTQPGPDYAPAWQPQGKK